MSLQWIWQHPDWPNLVPASSSPGREESDFARGVESHPVQLSQNSENENALRVEWLSQEAMHTSAIEGEILNRDSVQASFLRRLGLAPKAKRYGDAEEGIAAMMVDLCHTALGPLYAGSLCDWHLMLMRGNRQVITVGDYRRDEGGPMQIVSGALGHTRVHYEAPPSGTLHREMSRFINWFNKATDQAAPDSALRVAATAHLWFECIHPFEDGNGRLGRALIEKSLARTFGRLTILPISSQISVERKAYYEALNKASRLRSPRARLDTTEWIKWFSDMALRAQQRGNRLVEAVLTKASVLKAFGDRLNERQVKVVERLFQSEPDGFEGGLSSSNYQSITGGTPATTATRDLSALVEMGILSRTGRLRHTRYAINWEELRERRPRGDNGRGNVEASV